MALLAAAVVIGTFAVDGVAQEATGDSAAGRGLASASGSGQDGWNDQRTLELVEKARERRDLPTVDASLENYRADVSGHIYFFVDREENPEPVLLRSDQVALDLYWAQPGQVKQVVRGMRSEEQFPIRDFRYYLDRYTVIQNGFDDVIRVGEGRDVRNVIHPLSDPGRYYYDYQLADSTAIRLPGDSEPIRVYEVRVRPRNFDVPGIIGSLFLERARGDLVRLAFTFTPSSYRDPRNERVEVMLENALWDGEYWLPRQQRLLVRRELPQFDIDVGTVIRAALTVRNYDLNVELPDGFFGGREVIMAAGPDELTAYNFDEGLFDGLDDVGLAPGTDPGTLDDVDIDAIAGRIIRERYLRGVSRVRFFVPTGSDLLRYDRAQGLVTGAGVSVGVGSNQLYGYGGYAWGAATPVAEVGWEPSGRPRRPAWFGSIFLNRPESLALRPAASGVMATVSAAALGDDLRAVALVTGATAGLTLGDARTGRWTTAASVRFPASTGLAARAAPFDDGRPFRPIPPLLQIGRVSASVRYDRRATVGPFQTRLSPGLEAGAGWGTGAWVGGSGWTGPDLPDEGPFVRLSVDGSGTWTDSRRRTGLELRATAGVNLGAAPYHNLWYLGGPNTLPGHGLHEYVGRTAAVADATAWRSVVPRWLRLRAFAAAGWADLDGGDFRHLDPDLATWTPGPTGGVVTSVGLGAASLDGFVRLDYGWRTDTWDGAFILSIDPSLWPFL